MPMPLLSAVVISGVAARMFDFHVLAKLWTLQKAVWTANETSGGGASPPDLFFWIISFLVTLLLGASEGETMDVPSSFLLFGGRILSWCVSQESLRRCVFRYYGLGRA